MNARGPHLSRRSLLRGLQALLLALFAGLWWSLARRSREAQRSRSHRLPMPSADGVSFHEGVILQRQGEALTAFSSRCPHLGCRISRLDGEELVCSCHGSRFGLDGSVRRGPAESDLSELTIEREADGTALLITEG